MSKNKLITDRVDALEKTVQRILKWYEWEEEKPQPNTTVTVWSAFSPDIVQSGTHLGGSIDSYIHKREYTIEGTPDIDRIIAETLEQGALAVKVECTEEFNAIDMYDIKIKPMGVYIWDAHIGKIKHKWGVIKNYTPYYNYWLFNHGISDVSDSDIESAIKTYLGKEKEPPKSAHKRGEHFDDKWDYAGEFRIPIKDEYFVGTVNPIVVQSYVEHPQECISSYRELLIPRQPEFKVGDIVRVQAIEDQKYTGIITKIIDGWRIFIKPKNEEESWVHINNVYPATPEEIAEFYTVELAGEKAIAKKDENCEDIYFQFNNDDNNRSYLFPTEPERARALCERAGIPIMPKG